MGVILSRGFGTMCKQITPNGLKTKNKEKEVFAKERSVLIEEEKSVLGHLLQESILECICIGSNNSVMNAVRNFF
ncbi:hypothetical protein B0A62_07555 [Flavobacterium hydatis]|uniref:Uncharacterized protein n=1 Tax=Flavobacterium hydatis TaxID=991 RepID=A0A085ZWS0_FLAHY|nr:hypothetical protein IW20_23395 [Flavobacterium hydatis]OXA95829.1 hypothetical protein B0A62_07555 [Flavobacterium hydatis]